MQPLCATLKQMSMSKYEIGAIYRIIGKNTYYVRLLKRDWYGVIAYSNGDISLDIFEKLPYKLFFSCNSFPVKRGKWEKIFNGVSELGSDDLNPPSRLAVFANFAIRRTIEQHQVLEHGNLTESDEEEFVELIKQGRISHIFSDYKAVGFFLDRYFVNYPSSYIFDKQIIAGAGTPEYIEAELNALKKISNLSTE